MAGTWEYYWGRTNDGPELKDVELAFVSGYNTKCPYIPPRGYTPNI